jgi:hypothetical protein
MWGVTAALVVWAFISTFLLEGHAGSLGILVFLSFSIKNFYLMHAVNKVAAIKDKFLPGPVRSEAIRSAGDVNVMAGSAGGLVVALSYLMLIVALLVRR